MATIRAYVLYTFVQVSMPRFADMQRVFTYYCRCSVFIRLGISSSGIVWTQQGGSMTQRTTPPFRADHVGSFLRPRYLLDAREQRRKGEITPAQLRAVE